MKFLLNEESGQGMVEYGLILVLVSIVAIATLGTVGDNLKKIFDNITKKLVITGQGA